MAKKTTELLRGAGHDVVEFVRDSAVLSGLAGECRAAAGSFYPVKTLYEFEALCRRVEPDVVHAHEVYPLISPWIFKKARRTGAATFLTCHDYRLSCPALFHFRDGGVCFDCDAGGAWSCVKNTCCGTLAKSVVYAARNTWASAWRLYSYVDRFLVPSAFAQSTLIQHARLNEADIRVLPNPVACPSEDVPFEDGDYVAYVGRVSQEKGVDTLISAMEGLTFPLHAAGSVPFPMIPKGDASFVHWRGVLKDGELDAFYRKARLVVLPSLCHESFGLAACEALARNTPVIVSDRGALRETVGEGGAFFRAGDAGDLRACITGLWNDASARRGMAERGRRHVEQYSTENYTAGLISSYEQVVREKQNRSGRDR